MDNHSTNLILASASINRLELLSRLKINFEVIRPDISEAALKGESANNLVLRLGEMKAKVGLETYLKNNQDKCSNQKILVIGSDQVLEVEATIFGKPKNQKQAIAQLEFFSNKKATFHTSIVLIHYQKFIKQVLIKNIKTKVQFRKLKKDEITNYLSKENVLSCAGSFKSEGLGVSLLDSIKSSDHSAIIGLPLISLVKMLKKTGFEVLE